MKATNLLSVFALASATLQAQDIELDLTMEVELVSSVGNIALAEFLVGI